MKTALHIRFGLRLFLSTWLIVLLAGAALLLLEIPGRRTGFATYAHGWPFVYLNRDCRQDIKLDEWYKPDSGNWEGNIGGQRWINTDPAATENPFQEMLARSGLVLDCESKMTPWSVVGAVAPIDAHAVFADVTLVALLLIAVGCAAQRRRRRRIAAGYSAFIQFRLRTLLLLTAIVGSMLALMKSWRHDFENDQSLAAELKSKGHLDDYALEKHWLPPPGLPESLVKIQSISPWFERLDTVTIDGDFGTDRPPNPQSPLLARNLPPRPQAAFTDAIASLIARVPNLRRAGIYDMIFTDAGLARLADATSISELSLEGSGITTAGVRHLIRLPDLTSLELEGFGVNDDVLAQLNGIRSLEELTIYRTTARRARLHDLRRLQSLYVDCFGYVDRFLGNGDPPAFREIASMNPADVPDDEIWHPEIELTNLPALKHLSLIGVTLGRTAAEAIEQLPAVETLSMTDCKGSGRVSQAICDRDKLRTVAVGGPTFCEICLEDLPRLAEAEISPSETLSAVRLAHLPQLRSIRLDSVPSLSELDISDATSLNQLIVSPLHGFVPVGYAREAFHRPVLLEVRGLALLTELKSLALPDRRLGPRLLDDIDHLTGLVSLDLSGTWLSDSDLARLKSLVNIENLDLSGTDVTADGLNALENMPRLRSLDLDGSLVVDGDKALARLKSSHPNLVVTHVPDGAYDWIRNAVNASDDLDALWNPENWNLSGLVTDRMLDCLDVIDWLPAINLRFGHVTDAGLSHLRTQTHLQKLNLQGTHVTDAGLARLVGLNELESLSLADTLVGGGGLRELQSLPALKALDLSGCEVSDDDLANLRFLPNLERLWLADTKITDAGLVQLSRLPKLRAIDISRTKVTDAGLVQISKLAELDEFAARGCPIQGNGIANLQALRRLTNLDLSDARLNQAGLEQLARLTQLQTLVLEGISIPDAIKHRLVALKHVVKWSTIQAESLHDYIGRAGARTRSGYERQKLEFEQAETRGAFWPGLYPPIDGP